jgi:hypothetical protein
MVNLTFTSNIKQTYVVRIIVLQDANNTQVVGISQHISFSYGDCTPHCPADYCGGDLCGGTCYCAPPTPAPTPAPTPSPTPSPTPIPAIKFPGSTDINTNPYLEITSEINFQNTDFTIASWVRFDGLLWGVGNFWLSSGDNGDVDELLHLGLNSFAFYGDDLSFQASSSLLGVWNHYSCTYNYATKQRSLYLNGQLFSQDHSYGHLGGQAGVAPYIYLGGSPFLYGGAIYTFKGALRDFQIYNRSLEASEVLEVYEGAALDSPDLILHFLFTEQSGDQTWDEVSGIVGTLHGDVSWELA